MSSIRDGLEKVCQALGLTGWTPHRLLVLGPCGQVGTIADAASGVQTCGAQVGFKCYQMNSVRDIFTDFKADLASRGDESEALAKEWRDEAVVLMTVNIVYI